MSPRDRYDEDDDRKPAAVSTASAPRSATHRMNKAHVSVKPGSSTTRRAPLQSRDPNTISGSYRSGSSNSTEEYNSKDFRFSNLESSNNECNKRFMNSTNNSGRNFSRTLPGGSNSATNSNVMRSYSTSELREGSDPGVPAPARGSAYTTRSTSLPNLDADSVIIEEHRRKINGEGYTLHRYLRGKMLGKGGFAKVYLCTALDTNKSYAIKIVPKANLVKARARDKVRKQIQVSHSSLFRRIRSDPQRTSMLRICS